MALQDPILVALPVLVFILSTWVAPLQERGQRTVKQSRFITSVAAGARPLLATAPSSSTPPRLRDSRGGVVDRRHDADGDDGGNLHAALYLRRVRAGLLTLFPKLC